MIDIRALRPFDTSPIVDSVRKTGFLVAVEENHELGGWGSDVIARAITEAFDWFDRPPVRVTLPDWPMPYSPTLEDAALPSVEQIVAAVQTER